MKPEISVIIPHYRDVETTIGTIESLVSTIDIDHYEVIVVDDGSGTRYTIPSDYELPSNVKYIHHFFNLGVGQAFDTGVRNAQSDNIILMGADIRFLDNGWASRMLKVMSRHPKGIIATACGSTKSDRLHYGADVIFLVKNKDLGPHHPRKNIKEYRSVLEGKWRPRTERGVYAVPSLMGAFYGIKKSWYDKIRGFELHYKWGVLEPYISLKSWRMGGEVLVDSENKTLHIFNRRPQREAMWDVLAYNQLVISGTVLGKYGKKYAQYLSQGSRSVWDRGSDMYMDKIESIVQMAGYIERNSVMTPQQLERMMINMSYHYSQDSCKYTDPMEV